MKLTPATIKRIGRKTIYYSRVRNIDDNVLKLASDNTKLGNRKRYIIRKGKWKGFPLFSLTFEERKTCPKCFHWNNCYGNNMPLAIRYKHGPKLTKRLNKNLNELSSQYKKGFVIRLHILGDFYSVSYVRFWDRKLRELYNLYVFGYTSVTSGKIFVELRKLRFKYPKRWWVRFSSNEKVDRAKQTIYTVNEDYEGDSFITDYFICPEQTNKVISCIACAACWQTTKTVKFLTH